MAMLRKARAKKITRMEIRSHDPVHPSWRLFEGYFFFAVFFAAFFFATFFFAAFFFLAGTGNHLQFYFSAHEKKFLTIDSGLRAASEKKFSTAINIFLRGRLVTFVQPKTCFSNRHASTLFFS
jgi:hypothetical protein